MNNDKSTERLSRLLIEIRENNPNSINRFLKEIQQTVLNFGMKVCGGQIEDAQDTMQEVLTQFFRGARELKFNDAKALRVWLYKVAKNACLMSRRKDKYEPGVKLSMDELISKRNGEDFKEPNVPDSSNVPDRIVLANEKKRIIQEALLQIPIDYRLVLVLRDMEGLSTKEVSEVLGITESNVRVRLHRARLFMRNELGKHMDL